MDRHDAILDFWFGPKGDPVHGTQREAWFKKEPHFDAQIVTEHREDHERALEGYFDSWMGVPRRCLALIVALDQFPRNMFRGTPRAFAADAKALATAKYAVALGFDRGMLPVERLFAYLPFEHSEDLDDQRRSVALFESMEDCPKKASWVDYAVRHLVIIERFGRFPHRNAILGRASTPEELAFLREPNSSF
jgi:uncharacterized protein (DUF924 family)